LPRLGRRRHRGAVRRTGRHGAELGAPRDHEATEGVGVTMPDDFEHSLRQSLAMLAREAVPDAPASLAPLSPMRAVETRRGRRLGPRLLAAGVTIAVATASVVVALSLHG